MVKLVQTIKSILSGYPFRSQKSTLTDGASSQSRLEKFLVEENPITAEPVQNLEDLRACFRITYKRYLKRGYCKPNINKIYYNIYSLLPRSRTFAIKQNKQIVGTTTLIVDTSCRLPMDTLFGDQLDELRQQGRKLAEVSMLAIEQTSDDIRLSTSLTRFEKHAKLFSLFKLIFEYAYHVAKVSDLIIGVHPRHVGLYEYLLFKPLGPAKSYPGANGSLAVPMRLNFDEFNTNELSQKQKLFMFPKTPLSFLKSGIMVDENLIHDLIIYDYDFWNDFPDHKQKYLKEFYPRLLFAA